MQLKRVRQKLQVIFLSCLEDKSERVIARFSSFFGRH